MARTEAPGSAGVKHVPELDGVRGLAIALVLLTHFGGYGHESVGWFGKAFHGVIDFGWSGVDLFLVLSGFLITGILIEAKGSTAYFRSFYMRRALRILPLYYLAVAGYFWVLLPVLRVLAPGRQSVIEALKLPASEQFWYLLHLSNWRIGTGISFDGIDHFWSLAIEEQFYLFWPVVVLLLSRRALMGVCFGVGAVSILLRNLPHFQAIHAGNPYFIYCLTPFRLEPLVMGAIVAVLVREARFRQSWKGAAGAALVSGSALAALAMVRTGSTNYDSSLMVGMGFSGIALAYAAVVCYASQSSGSPAICAAALRSPLLVELGRLSYGIYIIHRPLSIFGPGIQAPLARYIGGVPATMAVIALGAGLSYLIALASWHVIEQPFLRLKKRFPYGSAAQPYPAFRPAESMPLAPTI